MKKILLIVSIYFFLKDNLFASSNKNYYKNNLEETVEKNIFVEDILKLSKEEILALIEKDNNCFNKFAQLVDEKLENFNLKDIVNFKYSEEIQDIDKIMFVVKKLPKLLINKIKASSPEDIAKFTDDEFALVGETIQFWNERQLNAINFTGLLSKSQIGLLEEKIKYFSNLSLKPDQMEWLSERQVQVLPPDIISKFQNWKDINLRHWVRKLLVGMKVKLKQ